MHSSRKPHITAPMAMPRTQIERIFPKVADHIISAGIFKGMSVRVAVPILSEEQRDEVEEFLSGCSLFTNPRFTVDCAMKSVSGEKKRPVSLQSTSTKPPVAPRRRVLSESDQALFESSAEYVLPISIESTENNDYEPMSPVSPVSPVSPTSSEGSHDYDEVHIPPVPKQYDTPRRAGKGAVFANRKVPPIKPPPYQPKPKPGADEIYY